MLHGCVDSLIGMRYELERINRAQTASEVDRFTEGRYRQFARHLGSGFTGQALDVGCNTGRGGQAFLTAATKVTLDGVELLADRIERIPAGVYRKVFRGLLGDVPGEAGPYDVLLMGELIEHVPFAGLDDLIEQCTRLLAGGGRLLLTTPNPHYALLRRRCGGTVLGGAHVSVHCPTALKQYLEWKGLEVETVTGSGPKSGLLGEKLPMALYSQYLLVARKPRSRPALVR
jgi:2-polyprenyl-3-methyl-5-hydroxy-6-metoxy-1,4-benzoquinol methylase